MRARTFSWVFGIAGLTACQGWRNVPPPTPNGTLEGSPDVVRVTRTIGCGPTLARSCVTSRGTIILYNPRIQSDSLIGYYDRDNRERVAVSVSDITNVEAREVDKVRTAGAVLGGAAIAAGVFAVLALIAYLFSLYSPAAL